MRGEIKAFIRKLNKMKCPYTPPGRLPVPCLVQFGLAQMPIGSALIPRVRSLQRSSWRRAWKKKGEKEKREEKKAPCVRPWRIRLDERSDRKVQPAAIKRGQKLLLLHEYTLFPPFFLPSEYCIIQHTARVGGRAGKYVRKGPKITSFEVAVPARRRRHARARRTTRAPRWRRCAARPGG